MKNLYISNLSALLLMLFLSYGAFAAESPYLSPIDDTTALVGEPFILDIDALNADPAETYELLVARPGMLIDPITGVITWTPADPDDGGTVTVSAYNSEGESTRSFLIYLTDEIICAPNLVSYWKLDETSGNTYADFQGGYTGTTTTPLTDVGGMVGRGKQFSPAGRTEQYINVVDNGQYDFPRSGGFSVSMWFRYDGQHSTDNNQVLVARGNVSYPEMFLMVMIDVADPIAPKITFNLRPKSSEALHSVTPSETINTGQWYHVVAVYDGPPVETDPANMRVYINNMKNSYFHTFGAYDFTANNDQNLNIGYWNYYPSNRYPFNGAMDEILIYDKALSDSEVSDIYNDGLAGMEHCKPGNYFPIFTSTPIISATQDVEYTYTVTANDFDGDPVTLSEETIPDWLTFIPGTGLLSGTPGATDVGDHDVNLHATDGTADAYQEFTITVANVNDPPVVTDIPDQTIAEGQSFSQITLDNYVSDADHADNTLTWTATGQSNLTVDITDRVASIMVNDPNWNGSETIIFMAEDPLGASDTNHVVFTVTPVNDPPVVSDIPNQTVAEGSLFAPLTLDNYVADPDDADSTITWTSTGQSNLNVDITNRVATITVINPEWNGSEIITFTAQDPLGLQDSDAAQFTVTAINDLPVVDDIPDQTIAEGQSFSQINFDSFVSDADHADSTLTWTAIGQSDINVSIVNRVATLTVDPDWYGSETVVFLVEDPLGGQDSDTAVLTVTAVNDAPVVSDIPDYAMPEGQSFTPINLDDFVADVDDPDNLITWTITVHSNVTINVENRIAIITPDDPDWNGSDTLIFTATDTSGAFDSDTSIFTVTPVNDAPTLNKAIPDTVAGIGMAFLFVLDPNTFVDVDPGDSLVYIASLAGGGSPPAWITFDAASRTFSGTPAEADTGTMEVVVEATDDSSASVKDTFKIVVVSYVGIGNPLAGLEIKLFPNPNNGQFVIESNIFELKDAVLEIFNENGQLIWNREFKNELGILRESVDLNNAPDGLYLLRVRSKSGMINKRFIIAY